MDHLDGDVDGGFAGDEDDAAPVAGLHAGEIHAAEADAAEDVDVEKAEPVLVGDGLEGLGLVDAEVIHEDVEVGDLCGEALDVGGMGEVADEGIDGRGGAAIGDGLGGDLGADGGAAVYKYGRAFQGEGFCDCESDARAGTADERAFAFEL